MNDVESWESRVRIKGPLSEIYRKDPDLGMWTRDGGRVGEGRGVAEDDYVIVPIHSLTDSSLTHYRRT